jgi:hypothetical protein
MQGNQEITINVRNSKMCRGVAQGRVLASSEGQTSKFKPQYRKKKKSKKFIPILLKYIFIFNLHIITAHIYGVRCDVTIYVHNVQCLD